MLLSVRHFSFLYTIVFITFSLPDFLLLLLSGYLRELPQLQSWGIAFRAAYKFSPSDRWFPNNISLAHLLNTLYILYLYSTLYISLCQLVMKSLAFKCIKVFMYRFANTQFAHAPQRPPLYWICVNVFQFQACIWWMSLAMSRCLLIDIKPISCCILICLLTICGSSEAPFATARAAVGGQGKSNYVKMTKTKKKKNGKKKGCKKAALNANICMAFNCATNIYNCCLS